jgi:hypothetical protein
LQGVFLVDFFASNSQMRFLVTAPWKKARGGRQYRSGYKRS